MIQWYGIEIDHHNLSMCTKLYKYLRDVLNCEGLSNSCLYSIIKVMTLKQTSLKYTYSLLKMLLQAGYTWVFTVIKVLYIVKPLF